MFANSTAAKVIAASVVAAGLGAGAVAATTDPSTPAPTGDCAVPYDRAKYFGSVPTPAARKASIEAATVDGVLYDYYTGEALTGSPDIDHIYSLSQSWPVTCAWTRVERRSFANDGLGLRPTNPSLNRSKGDQSPETWSPVDRSHSCGYGVLYFRVAAKWKLPVTEEAAAAVQSACADAIG